MPFLDIILYMKKEKFKINKIISDFEDLISDNPNKKATETKGANVLHL